MRDVDIAAGQPVILNIGCNKHTLSAFVLGFARASMLLSSTLSGYHWSLPKAPVPNVDDWWASLKNIANSITYGACGQCSGQPSAASSETFRKPEVHASKPPPPLVLCVEPLPINVKLLHKSCNVLNYDTNFPSLEVLDLAGSSHAGDIVFLPDSDSAGQDYSSYCTTVDALVEQYEIKEIDVLAIDTEGYDPLVLSGASKTLKERKVRYIEFEFHIKGPWVGTSLSSKIEDLDRFGYDCFWAGKDDKKNVGVLWPLTGTRNWDPRYDDVRAWSNIVCVDRLDQWAAVLEEYIYKPAAKNSLMTKL
ncbi:hypothetical protein TrST_g9444 [Triparma strigata]|uniref:Methyltransferase FkbM domain-containing protein n=1 Tax=Triparma strigata TaxID=1606541 RepID=A0A9W7EFG9_9STRA|nr:hypothetical protein TrST_g9444 [Triparma strigata]